jgi:hypothetical protein
MDITFQEGMYMSPKMITSKDFCIVKSFIVMVNEDFKLSRLAMAIHDYNERAASRGRRFQ